MAIESTPRSRRGSLLIVGAAVLWGTTGTAQALGPDTSDPLAIGVFRLVVAAAVLTIIAARSSQTTPGQVRRPATLVAAISIAAYQPMFFEAVIRTGVTIGTLVAIGSAPLFAGVLQWTIEQTRPDRRWLSASAAAIVGLALMGTGNESVDGAGVGLALGAGLSYAAFATAVGRLTDVSPSRSMATVFGLAAVISLPLLAFSRLDWVATGPGLLMVGWLGVVATAIAYLLLAAGLVHTGVNRAATLSLGEPITATVLGLTILGERPAAIVLIGASLIGAALVSLVLAAPTPSGGVAID